MEAPVAGRRQSPSAAKLPSTDGFDCGFGGDFLWGFFVGLMVKVGISWSLVNFCFENLQFW